MWVSAPQHKALHLPKNRKNMANQSMSIAALLDSQRDGKGTLGRQRPVLLVVDEGASSLVIVTAIRPSWAATISAAASAQVSGLTWRIRSPSWAAARTASASPARTADASASHFWQRQLFERCRHWPALAAPAFRIAHAPALRNLRKTSHS